MATVKQFLLNKILADLDNKIESLKLAIESAIESRDNETKSSVGDKYETGRTMMQYEVEKNKVQLEETEKLKSEILKINPRKKHKKVEFGSLVFTNKWNYFISIGLGKVKINEIDYICISFASPIGKVLFNKTENDTISFKESEILISKIL